MPRVWDRANKRPVSAHRTHIQGSALTVGLVGAAAVISGRQMLVTLATVCTNIIRDIPELVLMPLIYYGCTIGTNNRLEWNGNVHAFMRISAPLMSRH